MSDTTTKQPDPTERRTSSAPTPAFGVPAVRAAPPPRRALRWVTTGVELAPEGAPAPDEAGAEPDLTHTAELPLPARGA